MIVQEIPQPPITVPVMQMQSSLIDTQNSRNQQSEPQLQQEQQIQYNDNEDLTFQDLQPEIQQEYSNDFNNQQETQQSEYLQQYIHKQDQQKVKKQQKQERMDKQEKQEKAKKQHKKHKKHHKSYSSSDYSSTTQQTQEEESYDYYNPQPKPNNQQNQVVVRGTRLNQIRNEQDGVENILLVKNMDKTKTQELKIQKIEKIQKPQNQNVKSQQTSIQSRQNNNQQRYQGNSQNSQRLESIPDPIDDMVGYNYNDDMYNYNSLSEQQIQEQQTRIKSQQNIYTQEQINQIRQQQQDQQGKRIKPQYKQHKNKKVTQNKTQKQENDENINLSSDEDLSDTIVNEYQNLTDTVVKPQKFDPDLATTLQIENEQEIQEKDEVIEEVIKYIKGDKTALYNRKHANLNSKKTELIEFVIDPQKLTNKRETWVWENGQKVGIKLAFEVEKQQKQQKYLDAWNIRHQSHIQKIQEDETNKSIIFNKDGEKVELNPVLRFENYQFQQLEKGVLTASLSKSGDQTQQILEIEPQSNLSKHICEKETTVFISSGNCQLKVYGVENTQQTFYLRTYDTCLIPQDCEFEILNDKNVICVILLNRSSY